ncbi:hypothetical protein [Reichenbachiella versicolor]|uniref:hypothetical protein n=1 Tax=Reichenbachiella versicolor TaxID=1821036 RepID=UPI000D6E9C8E|nr:hypothetical protein [Reichenbachiella versicolor]
MKKITKYWKWNSEKETIDGISLGMNIQEAIDLGLVKYIGDGNYEVKGDRIYSIDVNDDKITSLYFTYPFFDFLNNDVWEMEFEEFDKKVTSILNPAKKEDKGIILYVNFRNYFVHIVGLQQNE